MLAHLDLERGLQHGLGQTGEQTPWPDEFHPLRPGTVDEVLRELLLIKLSHHGLDRVAHQ